MSSTHAKSQRDISKSSSAGSVAVEGTFAITLIFPIILGLIDLIRILFISASLHYTVAMSQRYAVLNSPPPPNRTRVQVIGDRIISTAQSIGVSLQQSDIQICQVGGACNNAGAPNQLVQITISKDVPTFFVGIATGSRTFNVSAKGIAKNEPTTT